MQKVIDVSKQINVGVSWIHNRLRDFSKEGFDVSAHEGRDGRHMTLDDVVINKLKERREDSSMIHLVTGEMIDISEFTEVLNYSLYAGTGIGADRQTRAIDVLSWFSNNDHGVFVTKHGEKVLVYRDKITHIVF